MSPLLAQVEIRERTESTCVSDNGFCPNWIADNFDRYVDPFFEHVLLTVVAGAIGFAISFALAVLAYRRRWLVNAVSQVTGVLSIEILSHALKTDPEQVPSGADAP